MSDIGIAQKAEMQPITEIGAKPSVPRDTLI
jgi:hypothetical protein